jgi:hypothetical protein
MELDASTKELFAMNDTASAKGTAIAGGLIAVSLLDLLVDRNILTNDDARGLLQRAQNDIAGIMHETSDTDAADAYRVINDLFEIYPQYRPQPSAG